MDNTSFAHVSDRELIDRIVRAALNSRGAVADLLEVLGEIDARRLYLAEGCTSLFVYCTEVLHFSEDEAYFRIQASRAARDFPVVLEKFRDGALTLTTITLLRPHLTPENAEGLIADASGKSKREVEHQMACVAPKLDAKSIVRKLPDQVRVEARVENAAVAAVAAPAPAPIVSAPRSISMPLSSDRYLLRVTLGADAHAKLCRAQDLMRHIDATGDPALIIDRALTLLVENLERRRLAKVTKARSVEGPSAAASSSRHVPAAVRREVWKRDGGRCVFVGNRGRCKETGRLEFHHVEPFACGGPTTVANLELRCRAHNQYEGALLFGPARGGQDVTADG